jgi:hypothetical protein
MSILYRYFTDVKKSKLSSDNLHQFDIRKAFDTVA